jgi:hypothetical protein
MQRSQFGIYDKRVDKMNIRIYSLDDRNDYFMLADYLFKKENREKYGEFLKKEINDRYFHNRESCIKFHLEYTIKEILI